VVERGQRYPREALLERLLDLGYERNEIDLSPGRFRARGEVLEVFPAYETEPIRVELFGDEVERILQVHPITGERLRELPGFVLFPATHYLSPEGLEAILKEIEKELWERVRYFEERGEVLYAQRLKERTLYDLEMLRVMGTCPGVENYARYFTGKAPGEPPFTLLDYFPEDFLVFLDESHVTVPQLMGMYRGDYARKKTLVDYGFRLPSALDNRPLRFEEFLEKVSQVVFVSATPGPFELAHSGRVVEQIIRPTGLLDPWCGSSPRRTRSWTSWRASGSGPSGGRGPWSRSSPCAWPRSSPTFWWSTASGPATSTTSWTPLSARP
jgi:excinuclease ABC subunit B